MPQLAAAQWKVDYARAADEAIAGKLDEHFPLYVADFRPNYECQRSTVEPGHPTTRGK
jgi:hypothetical protein